MRVHSARRFHGRSGGRRKDGVVLCEVVEVVAGVLGRDVADRLDSALGMHAGAFPFVGRELVQEREVRLAQRPLGAHELVVGEMGGNLLNGPLLRRWAPSAERGWYLREQRLERSGSGREERERIAPGDVPKDAVRVLRLGLGHDGQVDGVVSML